MKYLVWVVKFWFLLNTEGVVSPMCEVRKPMELTECRVNKILSLMGGQKKGLACDFDYIYIVYGVPTSFVSFLECSLSLGK